MRSVSPVSNSIVGVPPVVTTFTAAEKTALIVITSSTPYVPFAVDELTDVIDGLSGV